jgi:hypothetical protein
MARMASVDKQINVLSFSPPVCCCITLTFQIGGLICSTVVISNNDSKTNP